ncbi:myrosinase 1-like [Battus philenor]|uniref:myrosinase 1-like n=1 Tax=Battus philenor TaxID=42288 RepID=UPI0035D0D1BB
MEPLRTVVLCVLYAAWSSATKFPPGFRFGAASSAHQVEGAWNISDKGECIWDRHVHDNPGLIADKSNGDVACDSYHRWQEDIRIAAELNLHYYRFSISWSRLLPTGTPEKISEDGKRYYNDLINGLLEAGIQPMVTLYHFELPQRLQDLGGWTNPLIAEWFEDYARVVFSLYGDRVKIWVTVNEPLIICDAPYNTGLFAPGVKDPEYANYLCGKNLLLAHARAWRLYDKEFRKKHHGKIGIVNHLIWFDSASSEDEALTETARQYMAGIYSHPIYSKEGGWPTQIEKIIAENSRRQGYPRSRLPAFTKEEIEYIKGTYDFYGLNYYTSRVIRKARKGEVLDAWPVGSGIVELDAFMDIDPSWKKSDLVWFAIHPEGIRKVMNWIKKTYGDIEIIITENGLARSNDGLDDIERLSYHRDHLEQVWLAINEDNVNVTGYTAWTMMDNFEWLYGYTIKFGLYKVDFDDPKRPRTARDSAKYYSRVIKSHSYDVPYHYNKDEL